MGKTKLALLLAGIMILVTFSVISVNANAYYISGKVFDENTGKPIRVALIIESHIEYNRRGLEVLRFHLLATDSNGYFIDTDAPYTTVELTVLKLGYHRASQTVIYVEGGADVSFYLKPRW